jgi:hypothetical protein
MESYIYAIRHRYREAMCTHTFRKWINGIISGLIKATSHVGRASISGESHPNCLITWPTNPDLSSIAWNSDAKSGLSRYPYDFPKEYLVIISAVSAEYATLRFTGFPDD